MTIYGFDSHIDNCGNGYSRAMVHSINDDGTQGPSVEAIVDVNLDDSTPYARVIIIGGRSIVVGDEFVNAYRASLPPVSGNANVCSPLIRRAQDGVVRGARANQTPHPREATRRNEENHASGPGWLAVVAAMTGVELASDATYGMVAGIPGMEEGVAGVLNDLGNMGAHAAATVSYEWFVPRQRASVALIADGVTLATGVAGCVGSGVFGGDVGYSHCANSFGRVVGHRVYRHAGFWAGVATDVGVGGALLLVSRFFPERNLPSGREMYAPSGTTGHYGVGGNPYDRNTRNPNARPLMAHGAIGFFANAALRLTLQTFGVDSGLPGSAQVSVNPTVGSNGDVTGATVNFEGRF